MSWRQGFQMERALLERCPNTLFRRQISGSLKVPDLALPNCGFRSVTTTVASTPKPTQAMVARVTPAAPTTPKPSSAMAVRVTPAAPTYTSLAEIIPSESVSSEESVSSPRTPIRNRLVEKAARAYLSPSDSFNKSRLSCSSGQQQSSSSSSSGSSSSSAFSRFLPRLSVLTTSLNPFNAFNSAFQVFRFYVTGAIALQPPFVSRTVMRSVSMPVQRLSYASTR